MDDPAMSSPTVDDIVTAAADKLAAEAIQVEELPGLPSAMIQKEPS